MTNSYNPLITDEQLEAIDRKIRPERYEPPEFIRCSPAVYRMMLKEVQPNRHALYSAGWRSGFTVNGMRADGST